MRAEEFKKKENKFQEMRKKIFANKVSRGPSIYVVLFIIAIPLIFLSIPYGTKEIIKKTLFPDSTYISPYSTLLLLQKEHPNLLLINVAHPKNYHIGFIHGSMLIPVDKLDERISHLDKNRKVIIYSYTEKESLDAYNSLKKDGFDNIWIMKGGIEKWITNNYPLKVDLTAL